MKQIQTALLAFFASAIFIVSCSKGGGAPANPCAGVVITVSGTTTSPSATGVNDGTITAAATGGTGFTFSINGGAYQSSGSFPGLSPGNYSIVAKNSNGCTGSGSFTVTAPVNPCAGITINVAGTVVNPSAAGATNGSITTSATGSSGITYSLNGGTYQASGAFTNLAAGIYSVTAKDANGCTGVGVFTLTAPGPCTGITIVVTATLVNPTGAISNGSINALATGSTGFTFSINGGAFQPTGNFGNLNAGAYTVTAKDVNGCTGSAAFSLTVTDPCTGVVLIVNNTVTGNILCLPSNGNIVSVVTGGAPTYTYSLNGGVFQASGSFGGLAAGNYTVTAKDANGCLGVSGASSVVNLPAGPLFTAVRNILQANCVSCHNNVQSEGGMNWTVDCNIVTFRDRIKARAVDGNPSIMPPTGALSAPDKQKITDWINAGGRFSD